MKCGYSYEFRKFRCCLNTPVKGNLLGKFVAVDQPGGRCTDVKMEDQIMRGAQCLPINDEYQSYQVMEDYTRYLQNEAQKSCSQK